MAGNDLESARLSIRMQSEALMSIYTIGLREINEAILVLLVPLFPLPVLVEPYTFTDFAIAENL
jgi:hypothetical protein